MKRLLAVVGPLLLLLVSLTYAHAADDPCEINIQGCGAVAVTETRGDFHGAIYVPGSDAANAAVARSHGCEGCQWTLVLGCEQNTLQDPEYVHCNGARCPQGSLYRLYLQRPGDPAPEIVDVVCLTATQRIVTAADLSVDAQRYLRTLAPPTPGITVQPDERALVGRGTFFTATGPSSDSATLTANTAAGPARLGIAIAPATYRWEFGDGAVCETAHPGGPYDGDGRTERCADRVAHLYQRSGTPTVRLTVVWGGTYTFDAGFGPVGPLPIPGAGVAAPPVVRQIRVWEARAENVAP